ncbi:hypothetical protein [Sphingobium sp. WCS2017Hpa-17]|uniref:hypothetical protein n=1 Tax=Sphingobium sp. WCS2017Hpa-17 TaxID=3073638 RepID=UPI00288B45C7|nr:hypothetical protein [Sphingobium sp. WCS2017Hpa-17]
MIAARGRVTRNKIVPPAYLSGPARLSARTKSAGHLLHNGWRRNELRVPGYDKIAIGCDVPLPLDLGDDPGRSVDRILRWFQNHGRSDRAILKARIRTLAQRKGDLTPSHHVARHAVHWHQFSGTLMVHCKSIIAT